MALLLWDGFVFAFAVSINNITVSQKVAELASIREYLRILCLKFQSEKNMIISLTFSFSSKLLGLFKFQFLLKIYFSSLKESKMTLV